jgi:hypothetical protein
LSALLFSTDQLDLVHPSAVQPEFWTAVYRDPAMMEYLGGPFSEERAKERSERWIRHWERELK